MREVRRPGVSHMRLEQVAALPFSGSVYRFIGRRFLQSPLVSAGSRLHGGRFNPPGGFEVLYTALAADTALAEREGILLTGAGIKLARGIRTALLLRISCRLAGVLDLTDEHVREQLQIPLATLLGPWLPWNVAARGAAGAEAFIAPSQRIGMSVYASRRFEAIRSPSARDPAGQCLAIFPDRLKRGSVIAIEDPQGILAGALGIRGR